MQGEKQGQPESCNFRRDKWGSYKAEENVRRNRKREERAWREAEKEEVES